MAITLVFVIALLLHSVTNNANDPRDLITDCESRGGHLVVIDSQAVQNFIVAHRPWVCSRTVAGEKSLRAGVLQNTMMALKRSRRGEKGVPGRICVLLTAVQHINDKTVCWLSCNPRIRDDDSCGTFTCSIETLQPNTSSASCVISTPTVYNTFDLVVFIIPTAWDTTTSTLPAHLQHAKVSRFSSFI